MPAGRASSDQTRSVEPPATTPLPFAVAGTVTVVVEAICDAVIANVVLVAPAETVTEPGIVTNEPVCVSVTAVPPAPAGPLSDTVPVAEPVTAVNGDGEIDRPETVGGTTVKLAVELTPRLPVIVTEVDAATAYVATGKVAE